MQILWLFVIFLLIKAETDLLVHILFLIFNNCQCYDWSNLVLIVIYLISI